MKLLVVGEKTSLTEGLHDLITRRLHFTLGRFAPEIERVTANWRSQWPARWRGQTLPLGGQAAGSGERPE